ncbi:MAG TPA: hypothetical protein VGI61_09625 [Parafilimonas sp.]|jgi:hypothetical protein
MINNLHENNLERIAHFDNAVFFCMNASSERVPADVVNNFTILPGDIIEFTLKHIPVLEQTWNVFAGELYFYKKGLSFNMNIHGTAWLVNKDELTVQFKALYIETSGQPEEKPYSLQETLSDFFSNTGMFFKKMLATGF